MLSVAEASRRILARVRPLPVEEVPIREARGRILGAAIRAERPLPPWDNSAMDGFAVRTADLAAAPVELPVVGAIMAGARPGQPLPPGAGRRRKSGGASPGGPGGVSCRGGGESPGAAGSCPSPPPPG